MERMVKKGHAIKVVDYEIDWRKARLPRRIHWRTTKEVVGKVLPDTRVTVVRPSFIRIPYIDFLSEALFHSAEIYRQIIQFRPDVVVSLGIMNAYAGAIQCRIAGIPHFYYLIDSLETLVPLPGFGEIARGIISRTLKASTKVLVINQGLGDYAIKLGADRSKVILLGGGVDTTRINPSINGDEARKMLGIEKHEFVLFFMGWLYDFSGLREIALSLANTDRNCNLRLLVLGRGELSQELERIKRDQLKERILIVPWKPYKEIPRYLACSDVCLLPAHKNRIMRDIVPIKMYEYLAAGKPVIASSLPGITKEFAKDSGVVYIDQPEEAIQVAINLSKDTARMKELSSQALSFVLDRSWETLTTKFEGILIEELKQRQNSLIHEKKSSSAGAS